MVAGFESLQATPQRVMFEPLRGKAKLKLEMQGI
jgi:hypothetical protein